MAWERKKERKQKKTYLLAGSAEHNRKYIFWWFLVCLFCLFFLLLIFSLGSGCSKSHPVISQIKFSIVWSKKYIPQDPQRTSWFGNINSHESTHTDSFVHAVNLKYLTNEELLKGTLKEKRFFHILGFINLRD